MQNTTTPFPLLAKNEEEIELDDDVEELRANPCITDDMPSNIRVPRVLPKGRENHETVVTIPNSHDLHIVAAVLGSSLEETNVQDPGGYSGSASVSMATELRPEEICVEQQQEYKDKEHSQDVSAQSSSSSSSSSSSDSEDEGEEEVMVCDSYGDLKDVIDDMMAANTDHDDMKEQHDPGSHQRASDVLFGNDSSAIESLRRALKDVCVKPDDTMIDAGHVVNCLEGTLVISALPGSELLGEGSILLDKNKNIIGSIEDIFGPVQSPMYLLMDPTVVLDEHDASSPQGLCISPGDTVYSVPSLSKKVLDQEDLRVKGYDADDVDVGPLLDTPECEFSDDEAQAAYTRSLKQQTTNHHEATATNIAGREQKIAETTKRSRRPRQRHAVCPQQHRPATVAEFYASRAAAAASNPPASSPQSFLPVSFQNHHASSS